MSQGCVTLCSGLAYIVLLATPVYALVGFKLGTPAPVVAFVYALLLAHGVGHGLSEAFAVRAPHPGAAFAFYPIVVMLSIHTAGYTIKLPELSDGNPWRYYIGYVSPAR